MESKFSSLYYLSETLTVLSDLKKDKVVGNLCRILELFSSKTEKNTSEILKYYSEMCAELYKKSPKASISDYIYDLILYSENIFSELCAKKRFELIPSNIISAAKNDIKTLRLLSEIKPEEIIAQITKNRPEFKNIELSFPKYSNEFQFAGQKDVWEDLTTDLAEFYSKNGTGKFAKDYSFRVNSKGEIVPVSHTDKIRLSDLKLYESQKQKANDNILAFMSNSPYNNVLLYGDRGTGKSSCVKAISNEYAEKGLRIIWFEKSKLVYLGSVMQKLAENPLKFLIFIDDLTFSEEDESMNALKAVLEGSVCIQPKNTVIYATSNRRHIVKETFSAREGDELHREDTIDELMSLSDRFGLMITYQMPSKDNFLEITKQIAKDRGLKVSEEELEKGAERFALLRGYRSPRIARQYLDLMYKS